MMSIYESIGGFILDTLEVVVFAIAIFLFVYLLILQPHKIKGASMMPNFLDGEYLLSDKVTYRFREPERGDVVVFKAPGTDGDEYIKRIIGLPGESVSIQNGNVFIDGKLLEEEYIPSSVLTSAGAFLQEGQEKIVTEGEYFVLGDNRNHSSDSRAWGYIDKEALTGRAWFVYWPVSNLGTVEAIEYTL